MLIIEELSMIERTLLELVNAILEDFRCGRSETDQVDERPRFGGASIVLCDDYLQLLPVIPRRKYTEGEDGNVHYIPVNLVDELPLVSSLWQHVKMRRLNQQIRQSEDPQFRELLSFVAKRAFHTTSTLLLW